MKAKYDFTGQEQTAEVRLPKYDFTKAPASVLPEKPVSEPVVTPASKIQGADMGQTPSPSQVVTPSPTPAPMYTPALDRMRQAATMQPQTQPIAPMPQPTKPSEYNTYQGIVEQLKTMAKPDMVTGAAPSVAPPPVKPPDMPLPQMPNPMGVKPLDLPAAQPFPGYKEVLETISDPAKLRAAFTGRTREEQVAADNARVQARDEKEGFWGQEKPDVIKDFEKSGAGQYILRAGATAGQIVAPGKTTYEELPSTGNDALDFTADIIGVISGYMMPGGVGQMGYAISSPITNMAMGRLLTTKAGGRLLQSMASQKVLEGLGPVPSPVKDIVGRVASRAIIGGLTSGLNFSGRRALIDTLSTPLDEGAAEHLKQMPANMAKDFGWGLMTGAVLGGGRAIIKEAQPYMNPASMVRQGYKEIRDPQTGESTGIYWKPATAKKGGWGDMMPDPKDPTVVGRIKKTGEIFKIIKIDENGMVHGVTGAKGQGISIMRGLSEVEFKGGAPRPAIEFVVSQASDKTLMARIAYLEKYAQSNWAETPRGREMVSRIQGTVDAMEIGKTGAFTTMPRPEPFAPDVKGRVGRLQAIGQGEAPPRNIPVPATVQGPIGPAQLKPGAPGQTAPVSEIPKTTFTLDPSTPLTPKAAPSPAMVFAKRILTPSQLKSILRSNVVKSEAELNSATVKAYEDATRRGLAHEEARKHVADLLKDFVSRAIPVTENSMALYGQAIAEGIDHAQAIEKARGAGATPTAQTTVGPPVSSVRAETVPGEGVISAGTKAPGEVVPGSIVYRIDTGEALTVVSAGDSPTFTVKNKRGTEFKIGRAAVQMESPAGTETVTDAPVDTAPAEAKGKEPAKITPVAKEGKQPWEMSKEEFENTALYQGVRASNLSGQEGLSGFVTPLPTLANIYVSKEGPGGVMNITYKENMPEGTYAEIETGEPIPTEEYWKYHGEASTTMPEKIKWVTQISFASTEQAKEFAKDPHGFLVKQALAEGKPVPSEVLAERPDMKTAKAVKIEVQTEVPVDTEIPRVEKELEAIPTLKIPAETVAKENYRKPLSQYTDNLYHETNIENALRLSDPGVMADMTQDRVYFSNDPSIALGQGKNKGVLIEFEPQNLQGQVNTLKPTWRETYRQGSAEFVASLNNQKAYRDAIKSITVKPDTKGSKADNVRLKSLVEGWKSVKNDDGSTTYYKPAETATKPKVKAEKPKVETPEAETKGIDKAQQARRDKVLNVRVNFGKEYGVMTRKAFLEARSSEGAKVTIQQVSDNSATEKAKQEMDRIREDYIPGASNPNTPKAKRYEELKVKLNEGITKPEYRLVLPNESFYDITKTEYDYGKDFKPEAKTEKPAATEKTPAPEKPATTGIDAYTERMSPSPQTGVDRPIRTEYRIRKLVEKDKSELYPDYKEVYENEYIVEIRTTKDGTSTEWNPLSFHKNKESAVKQVAETQKIIPVSESVKKVVEAEKAAQEAEQKKIAEAEKVSQEQEAKYKSLISEITKEYPMNKLKRKNVTARMSAKDDAKITPSFSAYKVSDRLFVHKQIDKDTLKPSRKKDALWTFTIEPVGMAVKTYETPQEAVAAAVSLDRSGIELGNTLEALQKQAQDIVKVIKDFEKGVIADAEPAKTKTETKLDKTIAEMGAEVDRVVGDVNIPIGQTVRIVNSNPKKDDMFSSADPEIDARIKASHGVKSPATIGKIKELMDAISRKASREYEHLPRTKEFAPFRFELLKLSKQRGVAADKTLRLIQGIIIDFKNNAKAYNHFEWKVLLNDLAEEAKAGRELPFGYTEDKLKTDLARLNKALQNFTEVTKAVAKRKKVWDSIVDAYVKAQEDIGFKVEGKFNKQDYFRHMVLDYANERSPYGSGAKLKTPTGRGFLRQREGSNLDINTNYLEAEYEVMAQMLYDIEVSKVIKFVNDEGSITKKIKAEYKAKLEKLMEKLGHTTEQLIYGMKKNDIPMVAYENTLKSKIRELDPDALQKAGLEDWYNLIPEGYVAWQPREGNTFYFADSIPSQYAEKLLAEGLKEVGVPEKDIRKVLAKGKKFPEMVIKEELALTLDNLTKDRQIDPIRQALKSVMKGWKVYTLVSPKRWFKYNARNISGDAEAVFVGNPSTFKKVPQAAKELYRVFAGDGSMTKDMRDWFERGGMQSLLQAQEIGDVNNLRMFVNLMEKKGKISEIPTRIWQGYWKAARLSTDYREAILRYAAYLDFLEKDKKLNGKIKNFAASVPEEVMALKTAEDRSYWLSNDLLGAYDRVSVIGNELRESLIPFWSFQEANFKRYLQFVKNAARDGNSAEMVGRIALSTAKSTLKKSPFIAFRIGTFLIKAIAVSAMLNLYNNKRWPEEELELPANIRNTPHIVLGRDKNGKVLYFSQLGILGDFLGWFGLEESPRTVSDFLNGKKNLKEIVSEMAKGSVNKIVQGIGPQYKIPAELILGRKVFPDAFDPGVIRDRGQYIAQSLGLADEYYVLKDRPRKPYTETLKNFLVYSQDPGQGAYYDILDMKREFQKELGKPSGFMSEVSPKSQALYNLKLSIRYKDKEAFDRYAAEYISYGGTSDGLATSLRNMQPLYGLNDAEAKEFVKRLNEEDRKRLDLAVKFYEETLLGQKKK